MFRFNINVPRIGRQRSGKEAKQEDLVPLRSQSVRCSKQKPQLRLSMPPQQQQQLIIVDPPQLASRHDRSSMLASTRHSYARLEDEAEIIEIQPRRPLSSHSGPYRAEEYIGSTLERKVISDKYEYEEEDYYDGDQTPVATRRLIVEAPRHSRSRSRSSVASSRRSTSIHCYDREDGKTAIAPGRLIVEAPRKSRGRSRASDASSVRSTSALSARSASTTASASTTRSAASTRSSTTTASDSSRISGHSRARSTSTAPRYGLNPLHPKLTTNSRRSSVRSSSTSSYHRCRPSEDVSEDEIISVRSHRSRSSSSKRSSGVKAPKQLRGFLKYTSGRSRAYSKLR
jgi:hypothetical protein